MAGLPPRAQVGKAVGSEGLVAGQIVDIKSEGAGQEVGLETLQYIHIHKTACLLEAAVVSGALLGGATEDDVERLRKYSRSIGLAFQVRLLSIYTLYFLSLWGLSFEVAQVLTLHRPGVSGAGQCSACSVYFIVDGLGRGSWAGAGATTCTLHCPGLPRSFQVPPLASSWIIFSSPKPWTTFWILNLVVESFATHTELFPSFPSSAPQVVKYVVDGTHKMFFHSS